MKETKGFLLKTYLENDKPRIDGNASMHQHAYQYINQGHRHRKQEILKRSKNSCISYFRIHIKTDAFEDKSQNTTKSVVAHKERLQTIYQH